jgi:RHS repeat-associated protein
LHAGDFGQRLAVRLSNVKNICATESDDGAFFGRLRLLNLSGFLAPDNRRGDYYPYGDEMNPQPSVNTYRFTGYEPFARGAQGKRDGESGNEYAIFRHHAPRLGRFNRPDPIAGTIADPQSLNRYAYVSNDPVHQASLPLLRGPAH